MDRMTGRERYFVEGGRVHTVPAGKMPEQAGVDSRVAWEVDSSDAPGFHRWVGPNRGWVQTTRLKEAAAAQDLVEARARGDWHADIEARFSALSVRVEALERRPPPAAA
jgi:hypothetical protein